MPTTLEQIEESIQAVAKVREAIQRHHDQGEAFSRAAVALERLHGQLVNTAGLANSQREQLEEGLSAISLSLIGLGEKINDASARQGEASDFAIQQIQHQLETTSLKISETAELQYRTAMRRLTDLEKQLATFERLRIRRSFWVLFGVVLTQIILLGAILVILLRR